jgi:hypothetical protein
MAVSTNLLDITEDNWIEITDDVSTHIALFIRFPAKIRVFLSSDGTVPTPDNPEAVAISAGTENFTGYRLSHSFDNLEAGDDIFIRNESGFDKIVVVRGGVEIRGR